MLEHVTSTMAPDGQRIVIAGVEKVGKTTLACSAPGALLIPLEMGYASVPVAHTPLLTTWTEVEALCLELIAAAKVGRVGKSIVWDSMTALERIIHAHVIATDPDLLKSKINSTAPPKNLTMETAHGGYGKAYVLANDLFQRWTRYMDELAIYGKINCIVTCHVFSSKVSDPAYGEYNTWDLLLHSPKNEKTYGKREFITQWADMIGFMHEPLAVMKQEQGQRLIRAVDLNQGRQLAVDRTPGWVAGNRYGLTGTIQMPAPVPGQLAIAAWNNIADSIYANTGINICNR